MKELSLEPDRVLAKSLETELNIYLDVEHRFFESTFEQPVGLRPVYGKISTTLFFLTEKRLNAMDAGKVCTIAQDCFREEMHSIGWCANYKIDQEGAVVGDFKYRLMFSYINSSKVGWGGSFGEEKGNLCNCIRCDCYA